ncbi:MAG: hypothetical protein HYS38_05800 [Acidobacteria bacterium]|nr:hypothetical protein [Acidobacteriota bacterium]
MYDLLYQQYNLILLFVLVVITAYYAYTNRQIALFAQRQAKAAEESLRELREQVKAQQEVGRMIVENAVQSAEAKIRFWQQARIHNDWLPQTISLVPDQAGSALEHASRISKEAAAELCNAFDALTFAQINIEILRDAKSTVVPFPRTKEKQC